MSKIHGLILRFHLQPRWLNKVFVLLIFFFLTLHASGQNYKSDLALIEKNDFTKTKFNNRNVRFLLTKSKNPLIRYNPVSLTFGSLMFFYQKVLSPQFSTNCAYEISCSAFSIMCIHEFGMIKGIALSADRLTRCTQFAALDIHPDDLIVEIHKVRDHPDKYRAEH